MSILTVKNISHGFSDRAILEDVSFRLLKGEHVGLIGLNGEGKSTFMNIITGKIQPDEGIIEWANNIRIGYMDQHTSLKSGDTINDSLKGAFKYLFKLEEELIKISEDMATADEDNLNKLLDRMGIIQDLLDHNDFYIIDAKVEEVAKGLGLKSVGLDKNVDELSGGQRTKILLGKMLLEKPDILLLDEPTNYLDEEHIEWLKRFLQEYENAFILISHDIPFLNSVINLVYNLENKKLTRYVGDYDNFKKQYELSKAQVLASYERQQKEIERLEDFVARNKARVSTTGMAKSRQKVLDKMERIEIAKEKVKPEFIFKQSRASGKIIFRTEDLVLGYDSPLSKPISIELVRGDRIALVGANGIGKTTLLRTLIGEIKPFSGKVFQGDYQYIGYFNQEEKKNNQNTCIEEMWEEFPNFTQYETRAALAKCGLTTKHIESRIMVLSGGEQAKVRLCKILNRETNILLLDEPTNHLDVDAKEELKRALKEYKGTIVIVSHEPEFYKSIATSIWNCEDYTNKII